MHKFALLDVVWIKGRVDFFYLIENGQNNFEKFLDNLAKDGSYDSEIRQLKVRMQEMAELKSLPKTKCKDITPDGDNVKEYELKTNNLRVYLIHEKNRGRIIVIAGKKNNQKNDIRKFRSLKKNYLKSQTP
jgi:putative component of toxin-antitoxin plasmid stabilization module